MIHAREDYKDIQDPTGRIPEDEPVFLLRAQDDIAWKLLEEYVRLRRSDHFKGAGGVDEMSEVILKHADLMREWPKKKMADLPVATPEENQEDTKETKKRKEKA